ncbi:MAG: heteromeric transposase endonuclease subunit TnsA [Deltaproteobacteria bacterium HGW-Deltaproteobacteria-8]|nr:MAG: heteromeric transposase endonuclease subunit TnsA [Deltaproteobacteria bacterium HGW-Deltaproteobacteria-8]
MANCCDKIISPPLARRIGPTRRSVSGVYAFRGETSIQFESTLERDFLIRNEFSSAVLAVISQPVQIPFVGVNGRSYTYTPDYLVYFRLGNRHYDDYPKPLLVEVKPEKEWRKNWREWLPKWKSAYRHAKEQGWAFHVHDESRIRDQAFENIRFLERYKRMQFPVEESRWVVENVRQMGSAPLHYILARHFMGMYRAEGIAHIWHLLSIRQLDCDISQPLNDATEFWVPTDE